MYGGEMIWDLEAEGGPKQVLVGNPSEAIAADPKRYSRTKPEAAPEPAPEPQPETPTDGAGE